MHDKLFTHQTSAPAIPQSTTAEWQVHPGRVVVWGVGAFEQHGLHLPLDTDSLQADFFAGTLARELGAALLPTQRFGTSLEQTGFRGTLTLRPETLMAIVRDVADELERQQFTRLVLVNAHGGNYCLAPVVRDINRLNRPLKILLVNFWEYADPELARELGAGGVIGHADAFETSVMQAIAPELVRADSADIVPRSEALPLRQSDLNTFGIGHLSSNGIGGFPSRASRATGQRLVVSIQTGMLAFVQDRLRRLDEQPRYSGAGGIAVRRMIPSDLPEAMRLKTLAGWNQLEADWSVFLADPAHCFAALQNGTLTGTAVGIDYEQAISWIGMVLVDPSFRRMGIATQLMEKTIASLSSCRCIKVDATPAGKKVYDQLGFVDEFRIHRMTCKTLPYIDETSMASPVTATDLDALADFDCTIFGARRQNLLAALVQASPAQAWKLQRAGTMAAAALGRPGTHFYQVGPVLSRSFEDARAVLVPSFRSLAGQAVMVDVPEIHTPLRDWLRRLGFTDQRCFIRQVRGESPATQPAAYMAIAGPEFG